MSRFGEDMARLDEQDFDEKRLARRMRRKKSQITAVVILLGMLILIAALIVGGVYWLNKTLSKKTSQNNDTESAQESASEEASEEIPVIETPAEEQAEVELTEEDLLKEVIDTCLSEMPIEDKVAGLFVVTPEQLTGVDTAVKAGSGTQEALTEYAVGGIIYSAKNIKNSDQIKEMLESTASMSKYPIFTMVREDGGKGSSVSPSVELTDIPEITDEESAKEAGLKTGSQIFGLGFNFDLAPTLPPENQEESEEEEGSDKAIAASYAEGLQEAGVTACAGRFPLKTDTAAGMSASDKAGDDLVTGEFEYYKTLIDKNVLGAVMMSNTSFPEVISDNTPASLSSEMIGEQLRGTLGFEGIVMTAPLNEGAVTEYYTPEEAAVEAIRAGADLVLMPQDFKAAYQGVLDAINDGKITEDRINESLSRIYRIKYADRVSEITTD